MRILHYNIFEGGGDRIPAIAECVRALQPDVLGILEANGWEDTACAGLQHFAHIVDLPHADIGTTPSGFSVATLTNQQPTRFLRVTEGFHHALSGAMYRLPNSETIAILFYHANPFAEDARVREITTLAAYCATFSHAVVMGDFNALSPHDPYAQRGTLSALQEKGIKKFGDTQLTFAAITAFEQAGMIDVAHALQLPFVPTTPTPFNHDAMHAVPVRIDYAFVTPSLLPHVESIEVVKNDLTNRTSDHYPLLLILKDLL